MRGLFTNICAWVIDSVLYIILVYIRYTLVTDMICGVKNL